MSRIGKKPIPMPSGVTATVEGQTLTVKGPKGTLSMQLLDDLVKYEVGEGEIRAVTDGGIARFSIVDAVNPIERGYLVGPLRRQFKLVQPRGGAPEMNGVVVATLRPQKLIGSDDLVFVDRGKSDGVEVGTVFRVTRRGDEASRSVSLERVDDGVFGAGSVTSAFPRSPSGGAGPSASTETPWRSRSF